MAADTRPWETHYTVAGTRIVAETPDLRVVEITLAEGEQVPWHYHSTIADHFFCLEGDLTIETRAPRARHALGPGAECLIPAKTAHVVTNGGNGVCRFLLVQGIGAYDYLPVG